MPLNIDGQEVHIGEFGMSQFDKADIDTAFMYSQEKVIFNKKGSELKGILYEKKRILEDEKSLLEKKMAILKEELGERKSGTQEGTVDNIENNISYELTDDSVANATEEEKLGIQVFRKCAYKCMALCKDLKVINTLIKHLEDEKSYKLSLNQMNSIEKAETYIEKAGSTAQAKVEKVMKEFKDGTLKDSGGNKVSDRKQAIAIAMSQAGITEDEIEKFYPSGTPATSSNNDAPDTLTKKREMEKSDAFDVLIKSDVKGHYRRDKKTGKTSFVKQHTDKRTKKDIKDVIKKINEEHKPTKENPNLTGSAAHIMRMESAVKPFHSELDPRELRAKVMGYVKQESDKRTKKDKESGVSKFAVGDYVVSSSQKPNPRGKVLSVKHDSRFNTNFYTLEGVSEPQDERHLGMTMSKKELDETKKDKESGVSKYVGMIKTEGEGDDKSFSFDVKNINSSFNHKLIGFVDAFDENEYHAVYQNELYSDSKPSEKQFKTKEDAEKWVRSKMEKEIKMYVSEHSPKNKDVKKSEETEELIEKGNVKGHWRTTKSGKKVFVKQHIDKRTKKINEKGLFSDSQIKELRDGWDKIKGINPESPSYEKLIDFLDSQPQNRLRQLESSNINFLSYLAANRVVRTPTEKKEIARSNDKFVAESVKLRYSQNEEHNNHTGNLVLLAEVYGNASQLKLAKELDKKANTIGRGLTMEENADGYNKIHTKLYPKLVAASK